MDGYSHQLNDELGKPESDKSAAPKTGIAPNAHSSNIASTEGVDSYTDRPRAYVVNNIHEWRYVYLRLKSFFWKKGDRELPIILGDEEEGYQNTEGKHGQKMFRANAQNLLSRHEKVYVLSAEKIWCLRKSPECLNEILRDHHGKSLVLFFKTKPHKNIRDFLQKSHNSLDFEVMDKIDGSERPCTKEPSLEEIIEENLLRHGFKFPEDTVQAGNGIKQIIENVRERLSQVEEKIDPLLYSSDDNTVYDSESKLVFPPNPRMMYADWLKSDEAKSFIVKRGKNRTVKDTKPFFFVCKYYHEYVENGLLYSGHLREIDHVLYENMSAASKSLPGKFSDILGSVGIKCSNTLSDGAQSSVKLGKIISILKNSPLNK